MRFRLLIPLVLLALLVIACGGGGPAGQPAGKAAPGDPERGKALWSSQAQPACSTCHVISGQGATVGPELTHIATVAPTRKPGTSAEDYLRESIVDPEAFVVQGFPKGVMPSYKGTLNDQQVADIVAYYMTLK